MTRFPPSHIDFIPISSPTITWSFPYLNPHGGLFLYFPDLSGDDVIGIHTHQHTSNGVGGGPLYICPAHGEMEGAIESAVEDHVEEHQAIPISVPLSFPKRKDLRIDRSRTQASTWLAWTASSE